MGWLIGIVCIVIAVYFWRIFLPLGLVVALAAGIFYLKTENENKKRDAQRKVEETVLRQKISAARANASTKGKKWKVWFENDPASGDKVTRGAYITSNDGLCELQVQKRLNGSRLTGLDCPDFKISEYDDIEVKFDNYKTSDKMDIKSYSDSDRVFIPSYQAEYSDFLSYDEFIKRLKVGKTVAIKIPSTGGVWMAFTLDGASVALEALGTSKSQKNLSKHQADKQ